MILFSNLSIHRISRKSIYIFDSHKYALLMWGYFSNRKAPFKLITIDYHTDTRLAFNKYSWDYFKTNSQEIDRAKIRKFAANQIDPDNIKCVYSNLNQLQNDEQIDAALKLNYISDAIVISCSNEFADEDINYFLNECHRGWSYFYPYEQVENPYEAFPYINSYLLNRLEDEYFEGMGFSYQNSYSPFVLDIDLDYFPTRLSLQPKHRDIISQLVKNAEFITIAREQKYFDDNCRESDFSIVEAEELLLSLLHSILR